MRALLANRLLPKRKGCEAAAQLARQSATCSNSARGKRFASLALQQSGQRNVRICALVFVFKPYCSVLEII